MLAVAGEGLGDSANVERYGQVGLPKDIPTNYRRKWPTPDRLPTPRSRMADFPGAVHSDAKSRTEYETGHLARRKVYHH